MKAVVAIVLPLLVFGCGKDSKVKRTEKSANAKTASSTGVNRAIFPENMRGKWESTPDDSHMKLRFEISENRLKFEVDFDYEYIYVNLTEKDVDVFMDSSEKDLNSAEWKRISDFRSGMIYQILSNERGSLYKLDAIEDYSEIHDGENVEKRNREVDQESKTEFCLLKVDTKEQILEANFLGKDLEPSKIFKLKRISW